MGCLSHIKLATGVYDTTDSFLTNVFMALFAEKENLVSFLFLFIHFLSLFSNKQRNDKELHTDQSTTHEAKNYVTFLVFFFYHDRHHFSKYP